MENVKFALLAFSFLIASCSSSKMVTCPDGQSVIIPKSKRYADKIYKDISKEYSKEITTTIEEIDKITHGLLDVELTIEFQKLKEKLIIENMHMESLLKSSYYSLRINPCESSEVHNAILKEVTETNYELEALRRQLQNPQNSKNIKQAIEDFEKYYEYVYQNNLAYKAILKAYLEQSKALSKPPPFPWYPPPPSAKILLSEEGSYFENCKSYGDIFNKLNKALNENKYEKTFFSVPGGFAVVTKLEVINNDGSSRDEPERFDINYNSIRKTISLTDYVKALFWGKTGYFRTIVFIVTDTPLQYSTQEVVTDVQMKSLAKTGVDWLSGEFMATKLTSQHKVTALIYEFQIKDNDTKPVFCNPSRLTAKTHLEMSKIISKLK